MCARFASVACGHLNILPNFTEKYGTVYGKMLMSNRVLPQIVVIFGRNQQRMFKFAVMQAAWLLQRHRQRSCDSE